MANGAIFRALEWETPIFFWRAAPKFQTHRTVIPKGSAHLANGERHPHLISLLRRLEGEADARQNNTLGSAWCLSFGC
jgi:hypothetical protein